MQYNDHNDRFYYDRNVAQAAQVNVGLRSFMLSVYNHMVIGLAISAFVALGINMMAVTTIGGVKYLTAFGKAFYTSPFFFLVAFAPLIFIIFGTSLMNRLSVNGARGMFFIFSALMGASLSSILIRYAATSVVQVFFITAASFGALSLWGYTTKKDISAWGAFLFIGLVGIIIASLFNIFIGSSGLQFGVSVLGILIFAGLTAWDTQKLKNMYLYNNMNAEMASRMAIFGALELYLDFVNMFQFLLSLLGNRE
jgi:Integral membrane protein, interacts with FtsH